MAELFVIFVAAAWLNELVLAVGLAASREARRAALALGAASGVAVLLVAWIVFSHLPGSSAITGALPTRAIDLLFALGFSFLLLQLASGRKQVTRLQGALQRMRVSLPLLAASLAVLASGAASRAGQASSTLAICLGMPLALAVLAPVAVALLDRLSLTTTPSILRGLPITTLSAALVALGLTGLRPVLPW